MKRIQTLALWLLCSLLALPAHAEEPASPGWTPERALRVKRVTDARLSLDGSRATYVVASAVTDGKRSEWLAHVHVARVDGSGSFALTGGEKSCTSPAWSPDGRWIAFLSARGPGEKPKANLWRIRVDGGETRRSRANTC